MLNIIDVDGTQLADELVVTPNDDNRKVVPFHGGVRSITRLAEILVSELEFFASGDRVFLFSESDPQLQLVNVNMLRALVDAHICGLRLTLRDSRYVKERHRLDLPRQAVVDLLSEIMKLAHTGPAATLRKLSDMEADHARQRLKTGEPAISIAEAYGATVADINALRITS